MIPSSVRTLMTGLLDYAGLFPPATLDITSAARNYVAYQSGEYGWALGRFVVPATQIKAVRNATAGHDIKITALISHFDSDLRLVRAGNVDSIEFKAGTPAQIRAAGEKIPDGITAYFEIPLAQDPRKNVEAIAETGGFAKVRTGGITAESFPGSRDLARFLEACVDQNVGFKATAGLHHAVRGNYPLTYEPDAELVVMHGFLNVLLAAAFVRAGLESVQVVRLLEDQSPDAFQFEDNRVTWREESLDRDQIEDARDNVATSLGVCSFEEPIAELKSRNLL